MGTRFFPWWGEIDYPHFNMSFPHSRQSGLSQEKRKRLTYDDAVDLFGIKLD